MSTYGQKLNRRLKSLATTFKREECTAFEVSEIKVTLEILWGKLEEDPSVTCADGEKEARQREVSFNSLTAKEWASFSRNVWRGLSPPRSREKKIHGATFPKSLTDRLIRMYSKEGDLVFDPFLGTGTTLLSAKTLNRHGVGIELNETYFTYASNNLNTPDLFSASNINVYQDDCRHLEQYLEDNSVQLTVTSPPYADFIQKSLEDREKTHKSSLIRLKNNSTVRQYSESKEDFGNLSYQDFLNQIGSVLSSLYKKTKTGGYGAWVVKDYRDTKNEIPYIDFHSDLARVGQSVGFDYHDLIVWDQNENRSLVLLGYPSTFYTNQNCSFIVVFRKR
jgi:DNA modification methylase